jgi:acetoin utilization protein AcuB
MIVRKHMSAPPITVTQESDFKTAIALLQKHRIRRLPVVDARGALAGIVAERDLLLAADRYLSSPVDVAQIMTRKVVTIGDAMPVIDAATLMIERKIGGLPVINGAGKLLGIITETDLFRVLATMLKRSGSRSSASASKRPASAAKKRSRAPALRVTKKATRRSGSKAR